MTTLVLQTVGGIIGSAIGGPIGGSIGALAGSLLGNLIDPPKIQGPRLGDTRLTRSAYGQMIPYAWGQGRIGTIVIDQTDLVEHKHKSGGKGGPEVTTYTYTASWCSALCARLPDRDEAIAGITHIYADARLIWSQESGEECPCTVYNGSEVQEPDPTFEAIHGVDNVPAYRGLAYLTFTDFDLTDYGNRIPQIEVVIYTKGGDIPWRYSSFAPWETPQLTNFYHCAATYRNGVVTTVEMGNGATDDFVIRKWDIHGTQIGSTVTQACPVASTQSVFAVTNANIFMRSYNTGSGNDWHWFYYNENTEQVEQGFTIAGGSIAPNYIGAPMLLIGDFIFAVGHNGFDWYLSRFTCVGGAGGAYVDSVLVRTGTSGFNAAPSMGTSSDTGEVYVMWEASDGQHIASYATADLTLIDYWDASATTGTNLERSGITFHVQNGMVCNSHEVSSGVYDIRLVQLGGTLADVGVSLATAGPIGTQSIWLGGGLLLDPLGVYSINPPAEAETLGDIVSDISSLTPAQSVNVSELTDDVRWYVIGSEMTARNAIEKLRPPFFFDAVEEDYGIVFRKRGDRTVYEIDEADLVPFDDGTLLRTVRKREQELPRTVTMTYIDVDMDWQTGAQSSPRQVTQSEYDVTLEIPVGFTAQEAAQKCWTIQCAEWNERESFEWKTTRLWAQITPCALVKVRGRIIRVQTATESPDGEIAYVGVLAAPSIYTQTATGASSGGVTAQNPQSSRIGTELVLLDIPVLSQSDSPFGFYAAMGPASSGSWSGATLYKSLDGGVTYEAVAITNSPAVIGRTQDVSGSPSYSGALSAYMGGDVVEEDSIVVILSDADAELESCTSTALENGANLCAVSRGTSGGSPDVTVWEILQFRDATLLEARTYLLAGFKRGRKGTLTSDHAAGDTFVLLPVVNVDAPESELNLSLKYKAVTYGRSLSTASAVDFINTGEATESFYNTESGNMPIHVNEQTGTTYTITTGDRFRLITFNNSSPVTVTLPDGFRDGWNCFIENVGGGDVTLTPETWVIDDSASDLTLTTDQGILLASDGAQWWTMRGIGGGSGSALTVKDEGSTLDTAVTSMDFVGGGVTATNTGHAVTVTVPLKAPVGASYLTLGTDGDLTSERVLTAGTNVAFVDGGAGSTLTVNVSVPPSAGGAMTLISSITTSGSQSSVTFSSIPGTFTDLMIVYTARDTNVSNADGSARMLVNGDTTAANYNSTQYTIGSGSTTTTNTAAASTSGMVCCNIPGVLNQANAVSAGYIVIPNYAGTTFYKQILSRYESTFNSGFTISAGVMSGLWKSTSAVTSISIAAPHTAFVNGSVFSLYGLG